MVHARKHTRYVAGLDDGEAASGDPSPWTAKGVFWGIKECVARRLGKSDLEGVRVNAFRALVMWVVHWL